ncbi:hypothetical protein QYM36_018534 [Artemia franciscana]|uniref:Uncharacterized protein n=1 Tax=Artemia franciscana TaxID=6661 RepID=A0AA88H9A2_ARTSF|nr:hypothetical protein QYM36_018534 [Artemia franciscana]
MSRNISGSNNLYLKSGDITWHIKFLYHKIFHYKKAIALDIDIAFRSPFIKLAKMFDEMSSRQIMGLAFNQNPFYRSALRNYRILNPGTSVGDFPPGFPVIAYTLKRCYSNE